MLLLLGSGRFGAFLGFDACFLGLIAVAVVILGVLGYWGFSCVAYCWFTEGLSGGIRGKLGFLFRNRILGGF